MANNYDGDLSQYFACNIGKIVTVFTKSGGASGCGFTGLLVKCECDFVKLITELPSAPSNPFGAGGYGYNSNYGCCCNNRQNRCCTNFGTAVIIPICSIVSFVFNEV